MYYDCYEKSNDEDKDGTLACLCSIFFFQAEDGIRDLVRSRGLGDVYKRQVTERQVLRQAESVPVLSSLHDWLIEQVRVIAPNLSLIHI